MQTSPSSILYMLIIPLTLSELGLPAAGQQPPSYESFFASKQYRSYLLASEKVLAEKPVEQLAVFTDLVRVAMAAEKAGMRKDAVTWRITETLTKSPDAIRYFTATQKVMAGDWKAMGEYFTAKAPDFDQWLRCIPVWKEHGYEELSRLFSAVAVLGPMRNPEQMTQPLIDWVSFTGKERKFLDEFLPPYLDKDPMKLRELCNLLFNLYQRGGMTPANGGKVSEARGADFLDLALQIGRNVGFVSLRTADLFTYDRRPDALKVLQAVVELQKENLKNGAPSAQSPRSEIGQIAGNLADAAEACSRKGFPEEAEHIYLDGLKTVPDPFANGLRLAYCKQLRWEKNTEALTAKQTGADPLLAATALLVEQQLPEAARLANTAVRNPRLKIPNRLAAWGLLLKADPSAALEAGPGLLKEKQSREEMHWMGLQVWDAIDSLTPRRQTRTGAPEVYRPVTAVKDWAVKAAGLLETIVNRDPFTLPGPDGLRYAAACVLGLSGQDSKARDLLAKEVVYQVSPPKTGWLFPAFQQPSALTGSRSVSSSGGGGALGMGQTPAAPGGAGAASPPGMGPGPPVLAPGDRFKPRTFTDPAPGQLASLTEHMENYLAGWAARTAP
ncbi:MAG: hypothetical protein HY318_19875 [Armatimonadetes bacterium]|nr:hypothetical protein [Armatimonadota bacterium]